MDVGGGFEPWLIDVRTLEESAAMLAERATRCVCCGRRLPRDGSEPLGVLRSNHKFFLMVCPKCEKRHGGEGAPPPVIDLDAAHALHFTERVKALPADCGMVLGRGRRDPLIVVVVPLRVVGDYMGRVAFGLRTKAPASMPTH